MGVYICHAALPFRHPLNNRSTATDRRGKEEEGWLWDIFHPLSVKTTRSKPYFKRSFVYTLFPSTSNSNIARSMLSQRKHYTMLLSTGIIIDPFIKMNRSIFLKYMQDARASIFTLIFRRSSNIFFRLSRLSRIAYLHCLN